MTKLARYVLVYVCGFTFIVALLALLFEDGLVIKTISGAILVGSFVGGNLLYRSTKEKRTSDS
jgi:hypothetical protein